MQRWFFVHGVLHVYSFLYPVRLEVQQPVSFCQFDVCTRCAAWLLWLLPHWQHSVVRQGLSSCQLPGLFLPGLVLSSGAFSTLQSIVLQAANMSMGPEARWMWTSVINSLL